MTECLTFNGTSSSPRHRNVTEKRTERLSELEDRGSTVKLSSGYDMTDGTMKTWRLWPPAQDLHTHRWGLEVGGDDKGGKQGLTGVKVEGVVGMNTFPHCMYVRNRQKLQWKLFRKGKKVEGLPVLQSKFKLAWATKWDPISKSKHWKKWKGWNAAQCYNEYLSST